MNGSSFDSDAIWINLSLGSSRNVEGCPWNCCFFDAFEDESDDAGGLLFREISTPPDSLLSVVSSLVTCIFIFPASPETWNPLNFTSDFLLPETSCFSWGKTRRCDVSFFGTTREIFDEFFFSELFRLWSFALNFLCHMRCSFSSGIFDFVFLFTFRATRVFNLEMFDFRKHIVCHPGCVMCTIGLSDFSTGYSAVPGFTTTWTESACAVTLAKSLVACICRSPDLSSTWKCAFCPVLSAADATEIRKKKIMLSKVILLTNLQRYSIRIKISGNGRELDRRIKDVRLNVSKVFLVFPSINK